MIVIYFFFVWLQQLRLMFLERQIIETTLFGDNLLSLVIRDQYVYIDMTMTYRPKLFKVVFDIVQCCRR